MTIKKGIIYIVIISLICLSGCSLMTSEIDSIVWEEAKASIPHEWQSSFPAGQMECTVNAQIEYNNTPPSICYVELDKFTIEDIQKFVSYFDVRPASEVGFPVDDFYITSQGEDIYIGAVENFFGMQRGQEGAIQLEEWIIPGDAYPGEPAGTRLENVKISESDAVSLVATALNELSICDVALSHSTKARILTDEYITLTEGWYLSYTYDYGLVPFDTDYASGYGDLSFIPGDYTTPWDPMGIDIFVDEMGIQSFRFYNRTKVVVEEQANILPFDEIKDIIVSLFKEGYVDSILYEECDFPEITRITLSHALLKDGQAGRLVPTWIVYYTTPLYEEMYLRPGALCINAITGERVDPFYS